MRGEAGSAPRAGNETVHADEVADYLADVVHQLAELAATARLERVGYLLSLAAQEAGSSRPRRARRLADRF
jgi:hypothetical protein